MAKMHSYSVDNQPFRLTILSWMAFATFFTVLLVHSLKERNFDFLSFLKTYLPFGSLVTITFLIIYWVYDQFTWKINRFDKIPNLSGTWIGLGSNPYFEPLRLELMQIKQHWSKICITVKVYKEDNFNPTEASSWLEAIDTREAAVRIGTERSTIALITEYENNDSDLVFNYQHGEPGDEDHFKGIMFLKYEKVGEFHELKGKYLNSKKGAHLNKKSQSEENFEGVVGRIAFRRVSFELIEIEKALQKVKDEKVLVRLYREVTARIQGSPKA
jgi:hypothetical protein